MDVFTAIETRRAVKSFDADHQMSPEDEKKILDAAILSPTAFNIQHWRFVIVRNPDMRAKLREAAWGQAQVTDSSLLIVLCADKSAWKKTPSRYWRHANKEVQDYLIPAIEQYYTSKDRVQQDECMRSCGIVAQTIMLSAKALGYDSCPMDGFDFDKAAELVNLPEDHVISMFIAIGKATDPAHPRGGQLALDELIIEDSF
jgi:nitroreductase